MCVEGECKSVVPYILGRIVCLRHCADGDGVDHILLAAARYLVKEAVVRIGQSFSAANSHLEAQFGDKFDKSVELLGVRFIVHTVYEGLGFLRFLAFLVSSFAYKLSNVAVCQQHKLLYQPVGFLLLLDVYAYRLGVLVELEFHLLCVEVDGALFVAFFAQYRCQLVQFQNRLVRLAFRFPLSVFRFLLSVFNNLLCLLVVVAAVAVDHRLAKPAPQDLRLVVHLKDGAEAQLVLVGPQRADAVAQFLRQHRYGAVNQIYACAALVGLAVNGAAGLYIVRYVGNMDAHLVVAVLQALERHGVVKVFRVGRVDGEGRRLAEVAPAFYVLLGGSLDCRRLFLGFRGKVERKVVFCQYRLHLYVVVARLAKPLDDLAHRVVHLLGPVSHLHYRLLAVFGTGKITERYENVNYHIAVVAYQEGKLLHLLHTAHKACFGSLQNLHHLAFRLVHLSLWEHQHFHRVAVQRVARVVGCNHHILASLLVRDDVGFTRLLHIDGAYKVVLRHQVVVYMLGVYLVLASSLFDQYLGFGHLVYSGLYQLALGLVVGAYFR